MPLITVIADGKQRKSLCRTWTGVLTHSWGCRNTPARLYLSDDVSHWVLEEDVGGTAWRVHARFWPTLKAAMLEVDDAITDLETSRG